MINGRAMCAAHFTVMTRPLLPSFPGLIFDLDGTLIDSLREITSTVNDTMREYGWPPHMPEDYRKMIGEGDRELLHKAVPELVARDAEKMNEVVARFRAIYAAHYEDHESVPYTGINDLLRRLEQAGVRMSVLTNKPHPVALLSVRSGLPGLAWQAVQGQQDDKPRKPDPYFALEIADKMELPPHQILFVGDSPVDILTARAAGMPSCAVMWGLTKPEALREAAPDYTAETVADLERLLLP